VKRNCTHNSGDASHRGYGFLVQPAASNVYPTSSLISPLGGERMESWVDAVCSDFTPGKRFATGIGDRRWHGRP
jgi:hypothetical protein